MSLTLYRARMSREAGRVRSAILFETAVIAATLVAIGAIAGALSAVFHL